MHAEVQLKYVHAWIDHAGRRRYRFRRNGFPGVELPVDGNPNSPEFLAVYFAALRGEQTNAALAAVAAKSGSGTVATAVEEFIASTTFRDVAESTQALRRPILKRLLKPGIGELPLSRMDARYIERWLEGAPTRGAKKTRLLALKPFFAWAHKTVHLIATNPIEGIKVKVAESRGHASWTDTEIEQYRARHPIGTRARLALELLLAVAARRGDGISLGRQHLKNGWLIFTQQKNRKRRPVVVEMPLPATLKAAIEACPSPPDSLTFLTNEWGRPFGSKAFGTWFRARCNEAELPEHCVPHGLRKAACRIMAESDCTPHEISAVSGHGTLKEVTRYTAAADRKRLAARAQAKVAAAKDNVVPLAVVAGTRT
jgi:integrase